MRYALALLVLAVPLTACGGVSINAVAQAATKATAAGSEHVAISGNVSGTGQAVQMQGTGDFQRSPALGKMTMTVAQGGKNYSIDEVMDHTTIYMRSPLFASQLHGKSWMSIDLEKAGKNFRVAFNQLASQSPSDTLAALRKAGSVQKIGTETVDGVEATHYRAKIDIAKNKSLMKLEQYISYKYEPLNVWIGKSNGLPVRMTMAYYVENAGNKIATSMQMDFSKYGEPVNVQVPSANDTVDMTKLGG